MSEKAEKNELPSLGIPQPRFQVAVDALLRLRDAGKFLVFLGRRSHVKLVGDLKEFQLTYSDIAGQDISQEEANLTLDEVRKYCSACVGMQNVERLKDFLMNAVFDDDFKKHKRYKAELEKQLEDKIKLVSEKLLAEPIKQRARRMQSATSACLEDVDVEIVQDRRDNLSVSSRHVEDSFLRLRVRYSDGMEPSGPIFFPFSMWGPWDATISGVSSFELECDESDIDLLIIRLFAAKDSLLAVREASSNKIAN